MKTFQNFHPFFVALHWLLAVLIIFVLLQGGLVLHEMAASDPDKLLVMGVHMIVGTLILLLMLVRLVARFKTRVPPPVNSGRASLNQLSRFAHVGFYVLVFAVCISGISVSMVIDLPAIVFGGKALPTDLHSLPPQIVHSITSKMLAALIVVHLVAVTYHQVKLKDQILSRMSFSFK